MYVDIPHICEKSVSFQEIPIIFATFAPDFTMMQRYFITLSYDGTAYHGWQIQPNGNSVQAELQRALGTILREEIQITGAGRTDTGVHARTMVAHFDIDRQLDCEQLVYRVNRVLPRDIAVRKAEPVSQDMHARFSAKSRTYHYYVHTERDPFMRHYSHETHYQLDFGMMNEAAAVLKEYSDFGAFCKSGTDVKTTLCDVTEAKWVKTGKYTWYFEITANRFLRNMVRAVVGTLIEVGRHRCSIDEFRNIIKGKKRTEAGESMPGNALFLEDIKY